MLAGPLVLGALLRLSAGPVTSYELGAWVEARGVSRNQQGVTTELGVLEAVPRAALQVESATLKVTSSYSPRLWLPTDTRQLEVLQRATVLAAYRLDPLYRLVLLGSGAWGISDLLAPAIASPAGTPADPIQPVGARTHIRYLFGEAAAALDATPTRQLRLNLGGAYVVDGGADVTSRATTPLQRGPRATALVGWQLSDGDQLDTTAVFTLRSFLSSAVDPLTGARRELPSVWIATVTETWRRQFNATFSTWVGGGGALTGVEGAGGGSARLGVAFPVLDLGLQYVASDSPQRLRVSGRYGPLVDGVTGAIYRRADTIFAGTWAPSPTWRLLGELTAGLAIGGATGGQSVVTGQLSMGHLLSRALDLTWGVRGLWQQPTSGATTVSYRQWGLFVALNSIVRGTL